MMSSFTRLLHKFNKFIYVPIVRIYHKMYFSLISYYRQ